jgi:hypothetical protein
MDINNGVVMPRLTKAKKITQLSLAKNRAAEGMPEQQPGPGVLVPHAGVQSTNCQATPLSRSNSATPYQSTGPHATNKRQLQKSQAAERTARPYHQSPRMSSEAAHMRGALKAGSASLAPEVWLRKSGSGSLAHADHPLLHAPGHLRLLAGGGVHIFRTLLRGVAFNVFFYCGRVECLDC